MALDVYDLATTIDLTTTISDFSRFPFQDSVRQALQATRTEQVLPAHTSLSAVVLWSHDGDTIAAAGLEGGTQLWEATDEVLHEAERISTPSSVRSLAFNPDDKLLAISSIEIVLWDRVAEEAIGALTRHSEVVRVLSWHPTGRWIASGSDDGTVII